jgi:alcohol dehydrogenase (nicotinoprotein)
MRVRAAVLHGPHQPWEITELELDEPQANEVRIKFKAAGLCHSDDHVRTGDAQPRFPLVGGHEGAGVIEAVGPGVTRVQVGDHVVCSYVPVCGTCRYCSSGNQNLCDKGLNAGTGKLVDGTFRFHGDDGQDYGGFCVLGTFAERAVISEWSCVKIDEWTPFEVAALVGCGVPTGWGSAVYAAGVQAGQTVVIYGAGGVGMNAVQGARYAGAKNVVVVDPVDFKLETAKQFGATHTFTDPKEAHDFVVAETWGQLADHAILTVGVLTEEVVTNAAWIVGKNGQVVITAVGKKGDKQIHLPSAGLMTGYQRRIRGALFGDCNPLFDIPRIIGLYKAGDVKLEELITNRYTLETLNQGYEDMLAGRNIRGVLIHDD